MSTDQSRSVLQNGTFLTGTVTGRDQLEVMGQIDGEVIVSRAIVHQSGKIYGTVQTIDARIDGVVQGKMQVKNLLSVTATGSVAGNIEYGELALERGGTLSAELRNIPPEISGDLELSVGKGKSVRLTTRDICAHDPDNAATDLTFNISSIKNGYLSLAGQPTVATNSFTQSDLNAGLVHFTHDNSATSKASFDVVVADASGATSGKPLTVHVKIIGGGADSS